MRSLELSSLLNMLSKYDNIKLYEHNADKEAVGAYSIDLINEMLFVLVFKLKIKRDWEQFIVQSLDKSNIEDAISSNIFDSDSLYFINFRSNNNYIFYNGEKRYFGSFYVSKNELLELLSQDCFVIQVLKKAYFKIIEDESQYIETMEDSWNIVDNYLAGRNNAIVDVVSSFADKANSQAKDFMLDLIIRDYYNMLRNEIQSLEERGFSIQKVVNTKILYK